MKDKPQNFLLREIANEIEARLKVKRSPEITEKQFQGKRWQKMKKKFTSL